MAKDKAKGKEIEHKLAEIGKKLEEAKAKLKTAEPAAKEEKELNFFQCAVAWLKELWAKIVGLFTRLF